MDAAIVTIHPERTIPVDWPAYRRAELRDLAIRHLEFLRAESEQYGQLSAATIDASAGVLEDLVRELAEVQS